MEGKIRLFLSGFILDGKEIKRLAGDLRLSYDAAYAAARGEAYTHLGCPTFKDIGKKMAEKREYVDVFDIVPSQETVNCRARTLPYGLV